MNYFNLICKFMILAMFVFAISRNSFGQTTLPLSKKSQADMIYSEAQKLFEVGTANSFRQSLVKYKLAQKLFQAFGNKQNEAFCRQKSGEIYNLLGEKEEALNEIDQALSIWNSIQSIRGKAKSLTALGTIYSDLGKQNEALNFYQEALDLWEIKEERSNKAETLNNIGLIYSKLGENKEALKYFSQALVLRREVEDKIGEAITLNNIGLASANLIESNNSLMCNILGNHFFLQCNQNLNEKFYIRVLLFDESNLLEKQKVIESYNQALAIFKAINHKRGEAITYGRIGKFYDQIGERQRALNYYQLSLSLRREIGDKPGEAMILGWLQNYWKNERNQHLAILYGKQSVNKYQELRQAIQGLDNDTKESYLVTIIDVYRNLADLLIAEGSLLEAQSVLHLLKDEEFSNIVSRGGEVLANIPYSTAEESSIKILDQLASLGREKGELTEKNEKGSLTEAERQRFKDLEKQIELTEAEFNKSLTALSAETNKTENFDVVVNDAQAFMSTLKDLGSGTVALYTVIVNDSKPEISPNPNQKEQIKTGWIILVTPEFRKAYPVDVKDLEQTIFNFRQTLTSPTYNPLPFAQELYKKMFLQTSDKQKTTLAADLDEYFKDKPNKTLMWSLDGIFRYVPIAALHDGKQYLVEKYRNTIFNTASKDRLKDAVKQNWTALGLGVSQGRTESGKTFVPLAGAKRELLKIVKQDNNPAIFTGKIKMDEQFTPDAMFDSLSFDKNPLVHIASHFSYQIADFDSSFLLLGQGKLTVRDLRVKSQLFSGVDLLTLSACETAVPDANGKDVEGFAYLAQSLGAKSVMATLWQVDDIGTQVLMPEFYRQHQSGLDKAEALRQAQLALLQGKIKDLPADVKRAEIVGNTNNQTKLEKYDPTGKPPFAHPYYWSPFVLIGNWR